MIKLATLIIAVFLLGIASANVYSELARPQTDFQVPEGNQAGGYEYKAPSYLDRLLGEPQEPTEVSSPADRVKEDQILVSKERVVLNLQNAEWATFTDTNSMDPVLDAGANAIEVVPASEDELQVGDIAVYESEYADGLIIHRIVYRGEDEKGTYFIFKGDNNPASDPGRIRFSQVRKVVVAIIY